MNIREIKSNEIEKVSSLISLGYFYDIFFKWCVSEDKDRYEIVKNYYKVYLNAKGCICNIAEKDGEIVGATVWLPHNVENSIYDDIDIAVGKYARNFRLVAEKSHDNEPKDISFYQLVGFSVDKDLRGSGIGEKLLRYSLDSFDKIKIPTYLEASTPYYGKGVYGKFNYIPFGEIMVFTEEALLYPLYRPYK
ncbi:MAG: GNAT family N-acetyltransferase [Defluviitaleaceae bacterium]|nr:GNAT family N-acetyltransferase [Defluviitaleaceae bacterium]